jgi:hypothetical protein
VTGADDRHGADALVMDRYLDDLLAAGDRHAGDVPADAGLDPELRRAGVVLRAALVRVHPSFRFEDRLAARLAELATPARRDVVAGGERTPGRGVVALPRAAGRAGDPLLAGRAGDPLLAAILAGDLDPADDRAVDHAGGARSASRPLIVGSAITSAAISIAGVVFVAWRASRPGARQAAGGAMARAARSAHARRTGSAVAGIPGGPG